MSEPFYGEIKMFVGNFAPKDWAFCNGQLLSLNQNTALFSLLGTYYGGNGINTFALPDMRGRVPIHQDVNFSIGTAGGSEMATVAVDALPAHSHALMVSPDSATTLSPTGKVMGASARRSAYGSNPDSVLASGSITAGGGGLAHENRMPTLAVNFIIAMSGIFPSRN